MIKVSLVIIFLCTHGYPQTPINDAIQKAYLGISEAVGWQDVPFAVYMISKNSFFVHDQAKSFILRPFEFERSIQNQIGKDGRESIGGMDQNTIPGIIMYTRAAYTLALNLIAPEAVSKNNYKSIFLFYKSIVYTHTLTELAKNLVSRDRPDKSDTRSFFSGHTSATFATATYLFRELDDYIEQQLPSYNDRLLAFSLKAASFSVLYGWAGYVAYSRMYDNKHYLSDVLLGAAAGTVISTLIYDAYFDEDDSLLSDFSLGIVNKNPSLTFTLIF